jgi:hypothetical protein
MLAARVGFEIRKLTMLVAIRESGGTQQTPRTFYLLAVALARLLDRSSFGVLGFDDLEAGSAAHGAGSTWGFHRGPWKIISHARIVRQCGQGGKCQGASVCGEGVEKNRCCGK